MSIWMALMSWSPTPKGSIPPTAATPGSRLGAPEPVCRLDLGRQPRGRLGAVQSCNEASLWSKAYGFIPDTSSPEIANLQTALTNVQNTYINSIGCGAVDPAVVIPQMNEELYAAGLQDYMDEKQRLASTSGPPPTVFPDP